MSENNPPADAVIDDGAEEHRDEPGIEQHLKSRSTWLRLVFMAIFYVLAGLVSVVASFLVLLGFFWVLFTGESNRQLQQAGQGIAAYLYQVVRYLTYNSDERPFPFGTDWPSSELD